MESMISNSSLFSILNWATICYVSFLFYVPFVYCRFQPPAIGKTENEPTHCFSFLYTLHLWFLFVSFYKEFRLILSASWNKTLDHFKIKSINLESNNIEFKQSVSRQQKIIKLNSRVCSATSPVLKQTVMYCNYHCNSCPFFRHQHGTIQPYKLKEAWIEIEITAAS